MKRSATAMSGSSKMPSSSLYWASWMESITFDEHDSSGQGSSKNVRLVVSQNNMNVVYGYDSFWWNGNCLRINLLRRLWHGMSGSYRGPPSEHDVMWTIFKSIAEIIFTWNKFRGRKYKLRGPGGRQFFSAPYLFFIQIAGSILTVKTYVFRTNLRFKAHSQSQFFSCICFIR